MYIKNLILIWLTGAILLSCSENEKPPEQKGALKLSYSAEEEISKTKVIGNMITPQNRPDQMVLTINDENGYTVFNAKRFDLIKVGDQYYSKNILLNTGSYTLAEFMVIDSMDNAVYIAPKAGSNLADYVNNPLPHEFEISEDSTTKLIVQVAPANLGSASEFGYVAFSFDVVMPYIDLEYSNFFKLSNQEIVDSLANILDIKPFQYSGKVDKWSGMSSVDWIEYGLLYTNPDGHKIKFWKDSLNNLYTISYRHYWPAQSNEWELTNEQIQSYLNKLFYKFGFITQEKVTFGFIESAMGRDTKWYATFYHRKFEGKTIKPGFGASIEGDTCKIYHMEIPVWYKNLDDIRQNLSDEELIKRAKNYFQESPEVDSIPEHLGINGYWLIHNKISKRVGSAIIDVFGSRMYVYLDIQNGELIEVEKDYKR